MLAGMRRAMSAHIRRSSASRLMKRPEVSAFKKSTQVGGSDLFATSMINGSSIVYVEQMFGQWKKDPESVHPSWNAYFRNLENGYSPANSYTAPPTLGMPQIPQHLAPLLTAAPAMAPSAPSAAPVVKGDTALEQAVTEVAKILQMLRSFQVSGHEVATIDPLELDRDVKQHGMKMTGNLPPQMDYHDYGFTEADLDRTFYINAPHIHGFMKKTEWKLRDLIESLQKAYCGNIGVEYMHITNRAECNWIRDQFEVPTPRLEPQMKKQVLERLLWATKFEVFLHQKFTSKRFGLDGCETFIPGLKAIMQRASDLGTETAFIGMPHRGRLNVLVNVLRKPMETLFAEFQGKMAESEANWGNSGDVKYHLGTTRQVYGMEATLLPNPSHLECVNPVVLGRVRAEIDQNGKKDGKLSFNNSMGILVHGDAAFAGQGVVYETMQMEDLHGYRIGGTIHIVVNNQIGFTTTPREARTALHPTEVAKTVGAPIFHVNANDPEAVERVCRIAVDYRARFGKDVVIDLVGYRKFGHNELDQPMFTQPKMYTKIAKIRPVSELYRDKLINEGVITQEEGDALTKKILQIMEGAFEKSKTHVFKQEDWQARWQEEIKEEVPFGKRKHTGVPLDTLREISTKINTIPPEMRLHSQIKKIYEGRKKAVENGKGIDWGAAEALAWGTLLQEGFHVRISGQDVERGTFSHRHAIVHDQEKDVKYAPLKQVKEGQRFRALNSHLSEFAVLGFELGYSYANPNTLVQWEAQFGDFANGAQVIIDQFLSSGEAKWNTPSGLVLNLPHGYDGMGPEHSSARLERYLQLMDDGLEDKELPPYEKFGDLQNQVVNSNMQICNISTAANYFHMLRRQMRRGFRKPLILMSPKKLLKLKEASSDIEEFGESKTFKRVITETDPEINKTAPKNIKRVIFCSGQVYYDLVKARNASGRKDIAIVRFEQIAPIPYDYIWKLTTEYSNAEVVWCQEEHFNGGAWTYVQPRFNKLLQKQKRPDIRYIGRGSSASTATGYAKIHEEELSALQKEAMG